MEALQFFTEFLLDIDEHHHVRKVSLDVPISKLEDQARKDLELYLLGVLPLSLIVLGAGLGLWRRYG